MWKFIAPLVLIPGLASGAIYDVQCISSCIASDGTTQPSGTILNIVQWCGDQGKCPFVPVDGVGNSGDVALVPDPQGFGIVYQGVSGAPLGIPAQNEFDCVVGSGTCTLPAGTGLSQWSGTGSSITVILPPNPIVGPQSLLQLNLLTTQAVVITVQSPAGTTLKTVTVTGPKVARLEYTNTGWALLPN